MQISFRFQSCADELIRIMEGSFGIKAYMCCMTSHTNVDDICNMEIQSINLVIRREEFPAAEYLQRKIWDSLFSR